MNPNIITFSKIQKIFEEKWYPFQTQPFRMNPVGIRTNNLVPSQMNDYMCFLYYDDRNKPVIKVWQCTTDPTLFYLKNPMNLTGTAAVKPGHYEDMWIIGMHRNKYRALVQYAKCTVFRNYMRKPDLTFIEWPHLEETGYFGINSHYYNSIEMASAGCEVQNKIDFDLEMSLVDLQYMNEKRAVFPYTLLTEDDFEPTDFDKELKEKESEEDETEINLEEKEVV